MQCFTAHIDALTSSHLAEISPECARYVQRTLQQALEKTATSPSPDDPQRHEAQVHPLMFLDVIRVCTGNNAKPVKDTR